MARHPSLSSPSPSPSPQRVPSDSDPGFDPVEEWLVDFDNGPMASDLSSMLVLAEQAPAPGEGAGAGAGKFPGDDGAAAFGLMEEAVEEEKEELPADPGSLCGGGFGVKEESETVSLGLGAQLGPDQAPVLNIGGDEAAEVDVLEGVVDDELSAIAADAEMNTVASVNEEMVGGGGKEESRKEELQSSEDEEEDEESSDASSGSEEEGDDEKAKIDESSEASSSSDEEETRTKKHGGGGIDALLEEGELMVVSDNEEESLKGPMKSKHEVEILPPVPKIEVQLEPHHKTLPVGAISAIMGERVIVEGSVQHNPLNEGSILWITESRTPLGIVDELFGPVKNPYYLVRYNSTKEVPAGIGAGTAVSFVTEFAYHILNMKELYSKGYDASGDNDEEQSDEPEFSDDEKEAEYKRSLRVAKRQTDRQHGSKKPSSDKKRAQPRARAAGFQKDTPPRIPDAPTGGHQSQPHFQSPVVADNGTRPLGPQNFPMNAPPMMMPPVPMNPAMVSPIQLANQMGGSFINPSQQFLPQQPNMAWPGGLPPPHPNMGFEGAALAAQFMQNMLIGANQYQQQFQNPNFGGFLNQMPMPPPQFMPQGGMPGNPMSFGGPPANLPFGTTPPPPMGQGNFGQSPGMTGQQGPVPGFPNAQGFGHLQPPPGDGGQPPTQFNSGQLNQGNSSFRGRSPQQRGGRHSPGRGRGRHRK